MKFDNYQIIETSVKVVVECVVYFKIPVHKFVTSSYMLPWCLRANSSKIKIEHVIAADGCLPAVFSSWERYTTRFSCDFKDLELKSIYELRLL